VNGYRTVFLENGSPSFSFVKTIFICPQDLEQNPSIFLHETMHVESRHYLDLFLFRPIQIVWWWNPLVWLMRTELGLLHEYEADEKVINHGIDATQYQLLLVRKAVGEQRFSLASGFQHAKLKNRITMMLTPTTDAWMRLSYLALIPLLAVFVYACNPSKNNKVPAPAAAEEAEAPAVKAQEAPAAEAISFEAVETKPGFNGGDADEFSKWVNSHLTYPEAAKEAGTQGRVMIQFTVNADGSMSDFKVVRSASPELDAEALRVLTSCTQKWTPGVQDGKPVAVTYNFPIIFQLR
jgi:TonB family protein